MYQLARLVDIRVPATYNIGSKYAIYPRGEFECLWQNAPMRRIKIFRALYRFFFHFLICRNFIPPLGISGWMLRLEEFFYFNIIPRIKKKFFNYSLGQCQHFLQITRYENKKEKLQSKNSHSMYRQLSHEYIRSIQIAWNNSPCFFPSGGLGVDWMIISEMKNKAPCVISMCLAVSQFIRAAQA